MLHNFYSITKISLVCSLSFLLFLAYGQASAQSQQIKQGETPKGIHASEWASIQKQMEMGKYKAYPQTDGSYASANLAHGLQIAYAKNGNTTLTPRNCNQADYHVAMRLEGIGYQQLSPLAKPIALTKEDLGATKGSKVTYQWNANLREWWVNDEQGLEQWFSLQEAPKGRIANTPLHLRMALQTDMQISQLNNRLQLQKGNTTLQYDKLKVWDATGKEISAEMRYTQEGYVDFYIKEASATYPLIIDPIITQQAYLKASNTGSGDGFGWAVAISGETIVVGAPLEDSNATGVNGDQSNNNLGDSGAAYVFIRNGTTWTQQAFLKPSNNPGSGDRLGWSVAISGETIIVGAPNEDSNATGMNGDGSNNNATNSGAAYVFGRIGTIWAQQGYMKASNTGSEDQFGYSVGISGETIAVGAAFEWSNATGVNGDQNNNSAGASGAAYIFLRNGTTWSQQAYLKASDNGGADDWFGFSIAISGETVLVGAIREASNATGVNGNQTDNSASQAGAVYVFVRNGTTWTQQAYLKASNTGANDTFGKSVAISGDIAIVGADGEDSNATGVNGNQADNSAGDSGAAYIFVRSGTTWTQQAYLKASNAGGSFGESVAISGEMAVVGADLEASNATGSGGNETDISAGGAGAAYVFVRIVSIWTQQVYLKASNTGGDDRFGRSVGISGETVVVGAYNEDSNATGINGDGTNNSASNSGATYIFSILPSPEINLKQNTTSIPSGGSFNFDTFTINQGSGNITFTIENTGNLPLNLTGSPKIVINGTHASDFTITETLPATIAAISSATFTINFIPLGVGTRTAQISIANNDSDENPYIINLTGIGNAVAVPEINLKQNTTSIASGGNFNFGAFLVNQSSSNITFTIENTGDAPLNLTGIPKIGKNGTHANDFTITETLPTTVNAGSSATFTIGFTPLGAGTRTAQISITNNDGNENPYLLNLTGIGNAPEMDFRDNSNVAIPSGGTVNFGTKMIGASTFTDPFTIQNRGTANLNFTGNPKIAISGLHTSDFTVTETLPASLAPNSPIGNLGIKFLPLDGGTRTAQISIANNDSDENPYIVNLIGIGNGPEINLKQNTTSIISGGNFDFGAFTVGQNSGTITFTIENIGILPLNLTGSPKIVISGTHTNDFTIAETLPATINANGSATFTINFTPSAGGTRTAQISIANNDSNENPYVINLIGVGNGAEINLRQNTFSIASAGSFDFGAVVVGQSSGNITFTIENTGNAILNLTGTPKIVKSGANAGDFTITETLPATINASGSATFNINFMPSGRGARTAQISIANNDSNENPYIINLIGAGIAPEINLKQNTTSIANAGSFDFGAFVVSQSSGNITFTIENTGNVILNLTGSPKIVKSGTHANDFTITESLPATVNANGSVTFTINFTPSSVGTRTAQISIANNDSDENPYIVNLTGVGGVPEINLKQNTTSIASAGTHDFGAFIVNQSSGNITFTVENTGGAVLNLTGNPKIVKSGTHASDFTITETLPAAINASGSATFTISFTPSSAGTRTAQISIANNDSDENPYIVNLTGTGIAPEINLKQNTTSIANAGIYDFGAFVVSQSSGNITFTVENTGGAVLNLTGSPKIVKSGTHASDFTITEALPTAINASGSATFTISFIPSSAGTRTAQISIANNDSDENPYIINLTGVGNVPCLSNDNVLVYPNPVKNALVISLGCITQNEISVIMFDAQGKTCLQRTLAIEAGKAYLRLRDLSAGLYLLQVQVGTEWITEKVVIEK